MSTHLNSPTRLPHEGQPNAEKGSRHQSVKACLVDGWKIFARRPRAYVLLLALPCLLCGLGLTSLLWQLSHVYTAFIHPGIYFWQIGMTPEPVVTLEAVPTSEWVLLGLSVVASLVGLYLFKACLWGWGRALASRPHARLGYRLLRNSLLADALRSFVTDAGSLLLFALLAAPIVLLAWRSSWWWLLLLLIVVLVMAAAVPAWRCTVMLPGGWRRGFARRALRQSIRRGGAYMLLELMPWTCLLPLWAVLLLPVMVFTLALLANAETQLQSEPSGLPTHFSLLYWCVTTCALALCSFLASLRFWPTTLLGSADSEAQAASPAAPTKDASTATPPEFQA